MSFDPGSSLEWSRCPYCGDVVEINLADHTVECERRSGEMQPGQPYEAEILQPFTFDPKRVRTITLAELREMYPVIASGVTVTATDPDDAEAVKAAGQMQKMLDASFRDRTRDLFECPDCGEEGFTAGGLVLHGVECGARKQA